MTGTLVRARSRAPIGPASTSIHPAGLTFLAQPSRNGLRKVAFANGKSWFAVNAPLLLSHQRKVPISGRSRNGASRRSRRLEGSSVADPRHRNILSAGAELEPRCQ